MAGPVPCGILYIIAEDARTFVMAEDAFTHIIAEQEARRVRIALNGPLYPVERLEGELDECG